GSSAASAADCGNQRTRAPAADSRRSLARAASPAPARINTPAEPSRNTGRKRIAPSPQAKALTSIIFYIRVQNAAQREKYHIKRAFKHRKSYQGRMRRKKASLTCEILCCRSRPC